MRATPFSQPATQAPHSSGHNPPQNGHKRARIGQTWPAIGRPADISAGPFRPLASKTLEETRLHSGGDHGACVRSRMKTDRRPGRHPTRAALSCQRLEDLALSRRLGLGIEVHAAADERLLDALVKLIELPGQFFVPLVERPKSLMLLVVVHAGAIR